MPDQPTTPGDTPGGNGYGKKDLTLAHFPLDLDWSDAATLKSLDTVYDLVHRECEKAIAWYYYGKKHKKFAGLITRSGAVVLVAIAGIIPMISEIWKVSDKPVIAPTWSTIVLAVAGLMVMLDKLGGYTSGWIRYVRASQALVNVQSEARLRWEMQRLELQRNPKDKVAIDRALRRCRRFLKKTKAIITAETNAWAMEFQSALNTLDQEIKTKTRKTPE